VFGSRPLAEPREQTCLDLGGGKLGVLPSEPLTHHRFACLKQLEGQTEPSRGLVEIVSHAAYST
jgi:hypothetical protein